MIGKSVSLKWIDFNYGKENPNKIKKKKNLAKFEPNETTIGKLIKPHIPCNRAEKNTVVDMELITT